MESSRLEILTQLVERNPKDSFALYGLAMEYAAREEYDKAIEHFRKVCEVNPNYSYAYFHAGRVLTKMGQVEEARRFYEKGIESTARSGDLHAKNELEAALAEL